MKYVLRHKEYKTYYCYIEGQGRRFLKDGEKAHKFRCEANAISQRNKFKHPDRWEIIEVIKEKNK